MLYDKIDKNIDPSDLRNRRRAAIFILAVCILVAFWIGASYYNLKQNQFKGNTFDEFAKYNPNATVIIQQENQTKHNSLLGINFIVEAKKNSILMVPYTPEMYVFNCYGVLIDSVESASITGMCKRKEKYPDCQSRSINKTCNVKHAQFLISQFKNNKPVNLGR